jgi:hypothetical protein
MGKSTMSGFFRNEMAVKNYDQEAELHIIEAILDASIKISDSHIFPLEPAGTTEAGATGFDFPLLAPSPYGGGVDTKDAGDITGGQKGF